MEMPKQKPEYVIAEMNKGEAVHAHFVCMPEDTKRHPLKSLNGFRRRATKFVADYIRKNPSPKGWQSPPRYFRVYFLEDWEMERAMFGEPAPPETTHANIFDFYKHIGYDHKRDRYEPLGATNGEGQEKG